MEIIERTKAGRRGLDASSAVLNRISKWWLVFCLTFALYPQSSAGGVSILSGRIVDVEGKPVAGARVYVYDSRDVRRPPDFLSASAGSDGQYRVEIPSGTYRAVARLKKNGGYGPLLPGDKHSGEPVEIELHAAASLVVDFTIADLREAAALKKKSSEDFFRISGKIVGPGGAPVSDAYVMACREAKVSGIPDFVSAGTGEDGRFTIFLPAGAYHFGAARAFPPSSADVLSTTMAVNGDIADFNLRIPSVGTTGIAAGRDGAP